MSGPDLFVSIFGTLCVLLGIIVTVRGNRKTAEITARVNAQQVQADEQKTKTGGQKDAYDQMQEDRDADRKAVADARAETDAARKLLADQSARFRTEVDELWKQIEAGRTEMAEQRRQQAVENGLHEARERQLIDHINKGLGPPAPAPRKDTV